MAAVNTNNKGKAISQLTMQLPHYHKFCVYFHILWVKEVNSGEIQLIGSADCKIHTSQAFQDGRR
jgi:hypothetical protein